MTDSFPNLLIEQSVPRRRLLVIHNYSAARRREDRFQSVLNLLREAGCIIAVHRTHAAGDAMRLAQSARRSDVDMIIVAGGDGTVNDAVNGFGPDSPPLGLIPLGTANVLAHEIDLSTEPRDVADCLLFGGLLPVVPGVVNGRRFMQMVSIGFDAQVVGGVSRKFKRRFGKSAYVLEAFRRIALYPCPALDATVDGAPVNASILIASRGRFYGGRFMMAPQADLAVPRLQVTLFPRQGRLAGMGYSLALAANLLTSLDLVDRTFAEQIDVAGQDGAPIQGDGDVVARMPARIGLADHPVYLVRPNRIAPSASAPLSFS